MNDNMIRGKWDEIKGEIRKTWGGLTGDEIERSHGNMETIGGLIQQRYGLAKEEVTKKLSEIFNRHADDAKSSLRNENQQAQDSLDSRH